MPAMLLAGARLCQRLLLVDIPLGQVSVVNASALQIVPCDVGGEMMLFGLLVELGL